MHFRTTNSAILHLTFITLSFMLLVYGCNTKNVNSPGDGRFTYIDPQPTVNDSLVHFNDFPENGYYVKVEMSANQIYSGCDIEKYWLSPYTKKLTVFLTNSFDSNQPIVSVLIKVADHHVEPEVENRSNKEIKLIVKEGGVKVREGRTTYSNSNPTLNKLTSQKSTSVLPVITNFIYPVEYEDPLALQNDELICTNSCSQFYIKLAMGQHETFETPMVTTNGDTTILTVTKHGNFAMGNEVGHFAIPLPNPATNISIIINKDEKKTREGRTTYSNAHPKDLSK